MIVAAAAVVIGGTTAFFSDTETSTGNTFTAGAIDLKVDSQAHYNGMKCVSNILSDTDGDYWWQPEEGTQPPYPIYPAKDSPCGGTWGQNTPGVDITNERFFDFGDVKPGDFGENTISLHVINNDAYVCATVAGLTNANNSTTEPESTATGNTMGGDLQNAMEWTVWNDNGLDGNGNQISDAVAGDNIYQNGEEVLASGHPTEGTLALYDATTGAPLTGGTTGYIGVAWSLPLETGNEVQTDSLTGNISFNVVQSRNNGDFRCSQETVRPTVGAANYVVGTPTCDITVDDNGTDDRDTIQEGVNLANAGQTVCVAGGNYNEFTVNKALTVRGLTNPEDFNAAFIRPSSSAVSELALVTASDVTITGLQFTGDGTTFAGQAAGIQISPVSTSLSNVNITYNYVKSIFAAAGSASKGIQWFTETNSGFTLSNSNIKHNTIEKINSTNKGGYGVQTVGSMSNVAIENNTISNTAGAWGAGVAVDTKDTTLTAMSGNTISFNQIMDGVSGTGRVAVQIENRVNAAGIGIHQNNIETLLYGGGNGVLGTEGTLNAENNWFGTATPAVGTDVFLAPGTNVVDFTPFEASAF